MIRKILITLLCGVMIFSITGCVQNKNKFEIGEKDGRKIVHSVKYNGGCDGNHKGIESLVEGMYVEDVIRRLEGIRCGFRATSCPDQLAQALKNI